MPELSGKLVVVTGAASGIGQACCRLFHEEGATVVGADIQAFQDPAVDLAVICDVSKSESVTALYNEVTDKYKRAVDGLCHCAGLLVSASGLAGVTEEVFDKVFNVNMKGTFLVNKIFAESMKNEGVHGSIVNISSIGVSGCRTTPAYSASKAAQVGWTLSIAKELAAFEIRCNTVNPGNIDTNIAATSNISQETLGTLRPHMPLGPERIGTPREVAQVCLFLLSDRASYVTASEYYVHGGLMTHP